MKNAKFYLFIFALIGMTSLPVTVFAANWYVDSSAQGASNGTSWSNAWTNFSQITGVSGGDTIYISGGASGSSKTYSVSTVTPIAGTPGKPVTYRIGQEASHNGTAIFNTTGGAFVNKANVVVSGDAGDNQMHFVFGNGSRPLDSNGDNIRISYVNCGNRQYGFFNNGGTNITIDHVYFRKVDGGEDRFAYLNLRGDSWDVNKVHDCTIELIRSDSGAGDDGIQGGSSGLSIYNNNIIGYSGSYSGGQHQDGWQQLAGEYIKIYNNYFKDIANYPIFADGYYGGFNHLWIYNNVVAITSSTIQKSAPPQGIVVGPDAGALRNLGHWPDFNDIMVANNTIADFGTHPCIMVQNDPGQSSTFTNSVVANNICINGSGFGIGGGISSSNNIKIADGSSNFVKYAPLSASNDFRIVESDTLFKNKGTNMSSFFIVDKNGFARSDGAWDIGAYEFGSISPPSSSPVQAPGNLKIIQ
ncbi:MAG: hypothetical protein MUC57_01025 [Desulfobacterales bacterium]|jgi:hypothetical protein|nr:hypothetical protein [Desulfobacterales bacterium]